MKKITTLFAFAFLALSVQFAYAVNTHSFRYTPSDIYNLDADYSTYQNSYFDSETGMQYWTKKSATRYTQTNVGITPGTTWTSLNYVYVVLEQSGTFLYNQFYVYGTSTFTNISGGSGHDPTKLSTFTVDGRTISVYRLETIAGLSLPTFEISGSSINSGTSTTLNSRWYAVIPSNNASLMSGVNSSSTLTSFLYNYGCPGCAPSIDWIEALGVEDTPVTLSASSSARACGLTDIGGCIYNAGVSLFAPNQTSVDKFKTLTLASSSPFSYVYDLGNLYNDIFTQSTTTDITVTASNLRFVPGATSSLTFISPAMISSVPYAGKIKSILTFLVWFLLAQTVYYRVLRMFANNSI